MTIVNIAKRTLYSYWCTCVYAAHYNGYHKSTMFCTCTHFWVYSGYIVPCREAQEWHSHQIWLEFKYALLHHNWKPEHKHRNCYWFSACAFSEETWKHGCTDNPIGYRSQEMKDLSILAATHLLWLQSRRPELPPSFLLGSGVWNMSHMRPSVSLLWELCTFIS